MTTIKELREWLDAIEKQGYTAVGVDEGGLTLVTGDAAYFEVGGWPEQEPDAVSDGDSAPAQPE